jgi:hypothetical protein
MTLTVDVKPSFDDLFAQSLASCKFYTAICKCLNTSCKSHVHGPLKIFPQSGKKNNKKQNCTESRTWAGRAQMILDQRFNHSGALSFTVQNSKEGIGASVNITASPPLTGRISLAKSKWFKVSSFTLVTSVRQRIWVRWVITVKLISISNPSVQIN